MVGFGVINATVSILSLIGIDFFRRRVDANSQTAIVSMLMASSGVTAFCMIVYGMVNHFLLAAGLYSLSYAVRIASSPINTAWINHNVESKVRATVLSMNSQVNCLGCMTGGPIIGAIGSAYNLSVALITTGLARVPITVMYARVLAKGGEKGD